LIPFGFFFEEDLKIELESTKGLISESLSLLELGAIRAFGGKPRTASRPCSGVMALHADFTGVNGKII